MHEVCEEQELSLFYYVYMSCSTTVYYPAAIKRACENLCMCVFIIQSTGSHRFLWDKLMLCSGDCFVNTSQLQFCQMREKSEYSLKPDLKTYEVKVNDLVGCHGILKDLMGIDHITY